MQTQGTSTATQDRWTRRWLDGAGRLPRRVSDALGNRPAFWSVAIAAASTLIFFWLLTPSFESNDDVGMMFIADGTFYGTPQPHLIFQNTLVGVVLSTLYRLTGAINWYSVWLYALHAGSFAVFLYVLFSDRRTRIGSRALAAVALVLGFTFWLWMNLQFTSVAFLVGGAGLILYLASAGRARVSYRVLVLAGAMVGIASLVRWRSFQGVILLGVPLLLISIKRVPFRRQVTFAASGLAFVLLGVAFSLSYYSMRPEWSTYFEFNDARGSIHHTGRETQAEEIANATGWTAADRRMFREWFYLDEELYTPESLETILTVTSPTPRSLWVGLRDLAQGQGQIRLLLLGASVTVGLILLKPRGRVVLTATCLWFAAVLVGLMVFSRLPNRVSIPVLALLSALAVFHPEAAFGGASDRSASSRWVAVAIGALALGLAANQAWDIAGNSGNNREASENFFDMTRELNQFDPKGTFVSWGNSLGPQRIAATATDRVAATLITLGWQQRSPMHQERLNDLGIENLYESIAIDEHVAVPLRWNFTEAEAFAAFYEEHYGFAGHLRPVLRFDARNRLVLYDVLVDYRLRESHLVEIRADGTQVSMPLDSGAATGTATPTTDGQGLGGWAVALDPPGQVDLLIALDDTGRRVLELGLPTSARDDVAEDHGVERGTAVGFRLSLGDESETARVFAVVDGRAVELDTGS